MERIDWNQVADRAKRMDAYGLAYAIVDCQTAAEALGEGPQVGKDASYYRDEASVYYSALKARKLDAIQAARDEARRQVTPEGWRYNSPEKRIFLTLDTLANQGTPKAPVPPAGTVAEAFVDLIGEALDVDTAAISEARFEAALAKAAPLHDLYRAAKVIALTPGIRAHLIENDPNALAQVENALAAIEALGVTL